MSTLPTKHGLLVVSVGLVGLLPGACDDESYRLGGRNVGGVGAGPNGSSGQAGQGGSGAFGAFGGFPTGGNLGESGVAGTGGSVGGRGPTGSGGTGGMAGGGGIAGAGTGGVGGGVCDLSGTWAAYTTIPVQWDGTAILSPGAANLQVWWLILRTVGGPFTTDIGQLCGIVLPPTGTVLAEIYGLRFLADATERLPQFRITGLVRTQDATFNTDPAAVAFGVSLGNPLSDPWPPVAELVQVDDDLDGSPGVTTPVETGIRFADPVVELSSSLPRANVMYVASRSVVVMRGSMLSCNEIRGELEVTSVNGTLPVLDGAIVGCRLSETGELCSPSQVEFVDTNAPHVRPIEGGTFVQLRARDGMTCAEVRGMYPALENSPPNP